MKQALSLGVLVAALFAIFVYFQEFVGASAFYIAALSMAMFAVIGPFGDYLKTGIAMLVGVIVAVAGIVVLAGKFPLPPDNIAYIALISGIAIFVLVLLSVTGLRIDAMFIGWVGYNAAIFPVYMADATRLATEAIPAAVGVSVSLLVGLVLSLLVIKIAMAVNK